MTKDSKNRKDTETTKEEKPNLPIPKPALAMTGRGFEPKDMDQAWRFACALAESSIVPSRYANKPGDCLIALDLSMRLRTSYLAVMQHVYSVKGRPAMEAVLSTALTNQSGLFMDPLEYEVEGERVENDAYRVRAFATRKSTGTVLYGPWISWKLVKAEGWLNKEGSKWKTMPEQMFHYRAASWFERRHCPEVSMGMLTPDEAESIPEHKHVDSMTFDEARKVAKKKIESEQGSEQVEAEAKEPAEKSKTKKTKKKAAKKNIQDAKFLYQCQEKKCGIGFDEPKVSGTGANEKTICPKCLSANIVATEDEKPEFMKDN